MKHLLVGIDGSARGEKALAWAAHYAENVEADLTLLCVGDSDFAKTAGVDSKRLQDAVCATLDKARDFILAQYPELKVTLLPMQGRVIDCLVSEADKHDAIVLGTHHNSKLDERTSSGATGLRVSISTTVPTVVVPSDWEKGTSPKSIMVAVASDDSSDSAIIWAAQYAQARGYALKLVSAWGLPSYLTRPAELMAGGIDPVGAQFQQRLDGIVKTLKNDFPDLEITGESIEGSDPSKTIVIESLHHSVLVMGTHSRSALGRMVFGSLTHSVLVKVAVPTIIVPQP